MSDRLRANIATIDEADLSSFHATEKSEREEGLKFINGVCADLGFDYLQFGMWNPRKGKNGTVFGVANTPKEYAQYYLKHELQKMDPRVKEVARSMRPIYWHKFDGNIDWEHQKSVMQRYNVPTRGLSIPLHTPSGDYAQIGVSKDTNAEKFEFAIRKNLYELYEAAEYLYNLYFPHLLKSEASDRVLGKREVEVLKMADTGKSAAEIARVLKISVGTVNVHLRSSRVKLGVKKTSEAVFQAKQKGFLW